MTESSRREFLERVGRGAASIVLPGVVLRLPGAEPFLIAGEPAELTVSSVSPVTVRLTLTALGKQETIPFTGALVQDEFRPARARGSNPERLSKIRAGDLVVRVNGNPPTIYIDNRRGQPIQRLTFDPAAPGLSFLLPEGPLLGPG